MTARSKPALVLGAALVLGLSLSAMTIGDTALAEHSRIVEAVAEGDGDAAYRAIKDHLSVAFETRLRREADG